MRLQEVEVLIVGNPPPSFGGRYFIFVKLKTHDGVAGWGEAYGTTIGPEAMKAVIEDVFSRHFVDENPRDIEWLFRKVFSSGFTQRPDLTVMAAYSALEMACWDILGKARNLPVWAMLGGRVREEIRCYSYLYPEADEDPALFYNDADLSAKRAAAMVEQGFTALKFDPAGPYTVMGAHQPSLYDLERSEEFCRKIRDAIGNRADIIFGTHGQFTTSGAARLARRIEPYDPLWFEEPCPPDNLFEFSKIAAQTKIPIATGERLVGKSEFAVLLKTAGAQILQPALGRVGGIWEAKKIAIMAENYNTQIAPHLYAGPIEWAANLHLATATPNFLIAESILQGGGFHGALIKHSLKFERGYARLSDAAGLGIEVDEALMRAHPYEGSKLHLEMQQAPHNVRAPSRFSGG